MDDRFTDVLIDEPELGLSPRLQSVVGDFMRDPNRRREFFPHLRHIFIATHSHLFLDRDNISNNFIVAKDGNVISINQVQTINDFHRLQFNLLGNTFESLFLPSAIVIVEGKTDYSFIDRVLRLRLKDKRITVIQANSDGQVRDKVHILKQTFGDLSKSPFRGRIFVVLDKVHTHGLAQSLQEQGIKPENIIIWSGNGIEYLYPYEIMAEIYCCTPEQVRGMNIAADIIEVNGISKTKNELSQEVVSRISESAGIPDEFMDKLLNPLIEIVS